MTRQFSSRLRRRIAAATAGVVLATSAVVIGAWTATALPLPAEATEPARDLIADTESDARTKAVESGKQVEVLALRGERRDVYANPDGSMTAIEHTQPVRTVKNGAWVEVDSTLRRRVDGTVAPVAATVDMAFSGGGDDAPLVKVTKAGRSFGLGWKGRLPEPALDGATATYSEVLPGVDLVVTASIDGFSHVLVVKTAEAASQAALARIDMPVVTKGTRLLATDRGGVEIVETAGGGVLLAANPPRMWDSGGSTRQRPVTANNPGARRGKVGVSVDAKRLSLIPDRQLLRGHDTVYPVFIDPVWLDENRTAWAMVDSGYPDEAYWKFDGAVEEGLGQCPESTSYCANSERKRLFYTLPTDSFKGKRIISAQFGVTLRHTWSGGDLANDYVDLYQVKTAISTGTTWNKQPDTTTTGAIASADPGAPSGGDCSYAGGHATEWNVKPEITALADKGTTAVTFGLRNRYEYDEHMWKRYCRNGHLRVNYNTPPSQPEMKNLGMTPGNGCTYDLVPGVNYVNRLPTLEAVLFDEDHGVKNNWGPEFEQPVVEPLQAQFELIWGTNEDRYTVPLTGVKYSWKEGRKFSVDLQDMVDQGKLPHPPSNTPIGWIVRGTDGVKNSNGDLIFGPWSWDGSNATRCRFVIDSTAPAPPTVTSDQFPNDDSLIDGVGEYGTLTVAGGTDVEWFEYDFSTDSQAPKRVDAVPVGGTETTPPTHSEATLRFMPHKEGPVKLTVIAIDAANNSSNVDSPAGATTYIFILRLGKPAGSWLLSDAAGSTQAADEIGTNHAAAGGGVTFGVEGPGSNSAATFDGTPAAYLSAPTRGVVNTGTWFAVAVWARLDDRTKDHTAVSINGLRETGFNLGYVAASGKWVFEIPDYDLNRFRTWRLVGGVVPQSTEDWTHLVGAYNSETAEMQLWVNGTLVASGERSSAWSAIGAVQIGRSYDNGHYARNWSGSLAEVKVYNRMVFAEEIDALRYLAPSREAYWQLNAENIDRTSDEYGDDNGISGPALTLSGDACVYHADPNRVGEHCVYDPNDPIAEQPLVGVGDLRLNLDANLQTPLEGFASTAANVIDTRESFTITARVMLPAEPTRSMTVWSLPGTTESPAANANLMVLRYLYPEKAWQVTVTYPDSDGIALTSTAVLHTDTSPVAGGVGQLLAVSYNSYTDEVTLYVDGTSVAVRMPFLNAWQATGGLQIGRHSSAIGTGQEYLAGVIDDMRVYRGVLSRDAVQYLGLLTEQPEL